MVDRNNKEWNAPSTLALLALLLWIAMCTVGVFAAVKINHNRFQIDNRTEEREHNEQSKPRAPRKPTPVITQI